METKAGSYIAAPDFVKLKKTCKLLMHLMSAQSNNLTGDLYGDGDQGAVV